MTTRRLGPGDEQSARQLFAVLGEAFDEPHEPLGDRYVADLLAAGSFWAVAAFEGDRVVGGVTAHTIPMTRSPSAELFVYDVAVHEDFRRRGVGRQLMEAVLALAAAAGIAEVFVPVDDEDDHAVAFYRSLAGRQSAVSLFAWDAADRS